MVLKSPPSSTFGIGVTRINRGANESQEQFDSTKDTATYQIGRDTHTLVLDGKLDEAILEGVRPYFLGEKIITDIRDLGPGIEGLKRACRESQDYRNDATVDLGTGAEWHAFPNYDLKNQKITSYDFVSGPGPQTLNARFTEDGGLDVVVSSQDKRREVSHSMRAVFSPDGACTPNLEGVTWHMAPEKK